MLSLHFPALHQTRFAQHKVEKYFSRKDTHKKESSFPSNMLAEAVLFLLEIFSPFQQKKKDNLYIRIIQII